MWKPRPSPGSRRVADMGGSDEAALPSWLVVEAPQHGAAEPRWGEAAALGGSAALRCGLWDIQ